MSASNAAQGEATSILKAMQEFEDIDADWNEADQTAVPAASNGGGSPIVRRTEAQRTQAKPAGSAQAADERSLLEDLADQQEEAVVSPRKSSVTSESPPGRCGFWRFKCDAIQRLNQFELFLVLLTLNGLVVGMQGALKSALLTKLERRFSLDSTTASLIVTANDMVFLPSVLLVSYFGSLGHRPRLLALSCFGYGIASFLFALPYFLFGPMIPPVDDPSMLNQQLGYSCPAASNVTGVTDQSADSSLADSVAQAKTALALFMLSGFVEGISSAPFWNLGVAFIDDVTGDFSGVFIGLIIASRLLSPTLGYQLYGKVFVRLTETLLPSEPRQRASPFFIPAWWLGFVCVAAAAVAISVPMALFPKKPYFNGQKYRSAMAGDDGDDVDGAKRPGLLCRLMRRINRKRAAVARARKAAARLAEGDKRQPADRAVGNLRGFLEAIKRLLSNPVYLCLLLGNMFEFMEINCVIAYMPKYLEMHFRIGSGDASMLTGVAGPLANVIGILISSAVASQVDWQVPQLAKYHACVNVFGILAAMVGFFFTCPRLSFVGGFPENSTFLPDCFAGGSPTRMSPFSTGCHCNSSVFKPVCIEGLNFYSPCSANCFLNRGNVSCSCAINGTAGSTVADSFPLSQMRERTDQLCSDECSNTVYIYLVVFVLIKLVRLSARSQEAVLQMRCVRPKDKAIGLGFNSFAFSIGGIWVPTFVGFLFKKACLVEQVTESGTSCLFYDTDKFRYSFVGFTTAALVPACVFFFLAWYFTEQDSKYTDMASRRGTVELQMSGRAEPRRSSAAVALTANGNHEADS